MKGFYSSSDILTIIQKTDLTLQNKQPAWLDDIPVFKKGTKEQHQRESVDVLTKLGMTETG